MDWFTSISALMLGGRMLTWCLHNCLFIQILITQDTALLNVYVSGSAL